VLNEGEPWGDLLTPTVLEKLLEAWYGREEDAEVISEAVGKLEAEVRESLKRPMVILYQAKKVGESRRKVWLLQLPSGATLYAKARSKAAYVCTCYFPSVSGVIKNGQKRWKNVAAKLVCRYAQRTEDGRQLIPPSAGHSVSIKHETTSEKRRDIVFVILKTWGFALDSPGYPWRGRLPDWEAARKPSAARELCRRLKPKRHWFDQPDNPDDTQPSN